MAREMSKIKIVKDTKPLRNQYKLVVLEVGDICIIDNQHKTIHVSIINGLIHVHPTVALNLVAQGYAEEVK